MVFTAQAEPAPEGGPAPSPLAGRARATFAEDGSFELQGLEPGRYLAVAHFALPSGSSFVAVSDVIDAADDRVIDLVIEARMRR